MIETCGKCKHWKGNLVPSNKSFGYCHCYDVNRDREIDSYCANFEFKKIEIPECPFCESKMEYKQENCVYGSIKTHIHMIQCTKCFGNFSANFPEKVTKMYGWKVLIAAWKATKEMQKRCRETFEGGTFEICLKICITQKMYV